PRIGIRTSLFNLTVDWIPRLAIDVVIGSRLQCLKLKDSMTRLAEFPHGQSNGADVKASWGPQVGGRVSNPAPAPPEENTGEENAVLPGQPKLLGSPVPTRQGNAEN